MLCSPWVPSAGNTHSSYWGFTFTRRAPLRASAAMSISLSKWPMLPTMALSFMRFMRSTVSTFLLPVAVMKMSAVSTTSSIVVTW